MKTLYLIRHAKSDWSDGELADFERGLRKKGHKDLKMMGSFLSLRRIVPDIILSSLALRAQETADGLANDIKYTGKIHYMKDLYRATNETLLSTIALQDNKHKTIFMVGHNPELTEFSNYLVKDNIMKFPTLGIMAVKFDMDTWEDIREKKGKIDFFIHPKQFKYYVPKQIQTILGRKET